MKKKKHIKNKRKKFNMNDCPKITTSYILILTFIVTGLYDIILRYMSLYYNDLHGILKKMLPFLDKLKPYFNHYSLLSAALIAGFVGAVSQFIIVNIYSFPDKDYTTFLEILLFLLITFVVSGLFGFLMKASGLFPVLHNTYYRYLDKGYSKFLPIRSLWHDAVSGIIVQITVLFLIFIFY